MALHPSLSYIKSTSCGKFVGREEELHKLRLALYKKRMKNVCLVGPSGCGKSRLVEEASRLIKTHTFLSLSLTSLISGTRYRGDLEEKLIEALNSVKAEATKGGKPIVVFIDEIHIMTNNSFENATSLSNLFKPYLSSGDFIIWGATTSYEWDRFIAMDVAFARRLCKVDVCELSEDVILDVLEAFDNGDLKGLGYMKKERLDVYKSILQEATNEKKTSDLALSELCIEKLDCFIAERKLAWQN